MKLFTTLLTSLLFISTTFGQVNTDLEIDMAESTVKGTAVFGAFGEIVEIEPERSNVNKGFYQKPTDFSDKFTGYTIQLTTSMERLAADNALFAEFGNLMIEENINPRYCYMMGDFRTQEGAEKFLETVILQRYPEAKVIRYKKGKRKKLN